VAITFGCEIRVLSSELFGGSSVKTSNPAPPHFSFYLFNQILTPIAKLKL